MTTAADVILTGGVTASSVFFVINAAFSPGAGTTFRGNVITAAALTYAATTNFVVSSIPTAAEENFIKFSHRVPFVGTRL